MRRLQLMGTVLLLLLILGLSASTALSNPPSQPPPPPVLQQAPKRLGAQEPPPPRTGFIPPPMDLSHLTGQRMPEIFRLEALPPSWDWRTQGVVTSVKDQGVCGACYTFASIGNFESKTLIDGDYTLPDPDFSENNAKECNWREVNNYVDSGNPWGGCSGGNYNMMASLFSQKGVVLNSCDPYVEYDTDPCNPSCAYQKTLLDWRIISGGAVPSTNVLQAYIQTYGPVYTSLYASFSEFSAYDGSDTLYYAGSQDPDHAVLIVGWDESLVHTGGTGGWIVKNSWGTGWGNNGYFTIAYGSASIGMYSSFIYNWQAYDTSGGIMYYDDDYGSNAWGCGTTTAWGLAKFVPSSNANVTRVEFWTWDITTDVDVYIYDDFDGTSPSNLLRSDLDNSFSEAGYHSVQLASPLPVTSGNDVIAVVKFTNSSSTFPVASDPNGSIETNRTYLSCDGNPPWYELGAGYGHDVAIRLRTSAWLTPTEEIYLPSIMKNY